MSLIVKLIIYFYQRLFVYDKLILFQIEQIVDLYSEVEIQKVNQDNIKDVLHFQDENYIKIFNGFLTVGDLGYYGYLNGYCIHRSWVIARQGVIFNLHPLVKRKLSKDEVYIHYCETALEARGKNVYPFVISEIAKEFLNKKILICVNEKNIPSIKGVLKAGFEPIQKITVISLLGVTFRRKQILKGDIT